MERLSSRERLLRAIAGRPVDRVPVSSLIHWDPLSPEPEPGDWKAEPNFRRLVPLFREHCDFLVNVNIPERQPIDGDRLKHIFWKVSHEGIFDRRFLLVPPERIEPAYETQPGGTLIMRYTVHTPGGDLRYVAARYPGDDTLWDLEPLLKDPDDARKLLSVPYRFDPPDLAPVRADLERIGEQGLGLHFVSTPLVMVSQLTGVQTFLEWTIGERELVTELLQVAYQRVAERLAYVLKSDLAPLYRLGGCEQAVPPLMGRRGFETFALAYDRPLWQMIRSSGKTLWVHCHGRIAGVLDAFIEGGVQMLDPLEPPPMGDIDLATARQRAAGSGMCLLGNLQWSEMADASPEEVESMVEKAMHAGGKELFILYASASPHATIDDRLYANLVRYVEAARKYGAA